MIEPLPSIFSIWASACSSAFILSIAPPSTTRNSGLFVMSSTYMASALRSQFRLNCTLFVLVGEGHCLGLTYVRLTCYCTVVLEFTVLQTSFAKGAKTMLLEAVSPRGARVFDSWVRNGNRDIQSPHLHPPLAAKSGAAIWCSPKAALGWYASCSRDAAYEIVVLIALQLPTSVSASDRPS